jgi:hypothetical protein
MNRQIIIASLRRPLFAHCLRTSIRTGGRAGTRADRVAPVAAASAVKHHHRHHRHHKHHGSATTTAEPGSNPIIKP